MFLLHKPEAPRSVKSACTSEYGSSEVSKFVVCLEYCFTVGFVHISEESGSVGLMGGLLNLYF